MLTLKKSMKSIVMAMVLLLTFSTLFAPIANAQTATDKNEAIAKSTYYSVKKHEVVLNKQEALAKNPKLTNQEINEIRKGLKSLSDETIDQILIDNGYDLDEVKINPDLAHANLAWFIPVIIGGIIAAGAIIFIAKYWSHKEKMNLIDKCYANDGYPVVDSRDKGGVNGTTSSAAANSSGGYKFECKAR